MDIPMPKSRYVEFAGRLYEYVVVHPQPRDRSGEPCKLHVDLGRQRLEVAGILSEAERRALVKEAERRRLSGGRLVRVAGAVS